MLDFHSNLFYAVKDNNSFAEANAVVGGGGMDALPPQIFLESAPSQVLVLKRG